MKAKIRELLTAATDPYLVVRVQNYFGLYATSGNDEVTQNGTSTSKLKIEYDHNVNQKLTVIDKNGYVNQPANGVNHNEILQRKNFQGHFRGDSVDSVGFDSPVSSSAYEDSDSESSSGYKVTNSFWLYLFLFGASLGYEHFYASFFPFWFWNVDSAVGRRVIIVWSSTFYIGQGLKDIIKWKRPASPPVVCMEQLYAQEYGMPSTHAVVGVSVPFSLLIFTMYRYDYAFIPGLLLAIAWTILVCTSRLYLGMHTLLDILGGLVLVTVLMIFLVPLVDTIDQFQLTHPYGPLVTFLVYLVMVTFYPAGDRWSPARGDTTVICGTAVGVVAGNWLNYHWGIIQGPIELPPYRIMWPTYEMVGLGCLRLCIGIALVVATRAVFRSLCYAVVCYVLRLDRKDLQNTKKVAVEVPYKFITYGAIGFVVTYLSPAVFRFLNIERATMYTEV